MNTLPKLSVIFMPQIAMGGGIRIETVQETSVFFIPFSIPVQPIISDVKQGHCTSGYNATDLILLIYIKCTRFINA